MPWTALANAYGADLELLPAGAMLAVVRTTQARAERLPGVERHHLPPALVEPALVDLAEGESSPSWEFLHTFFMAEAHLVIEVMLAADVAAARGATLRPILAVVLLEHP